MKIFEKFLAFFFHSMNGFPNKNAPDDADLSEKHVPDNIFPEIFPECFKKGAKLLYRKKTRRKKYSSGGHLRGARLFLFSPLKSKPPRRWGGLRLWWSQFDLDLKKWAKNCRQGETTKAKKHHTIFFWKFSTSEFSEAMLQNSIELSVQNHLSERPRDGGPQRYPSLQPRDDKFVSYCRQHILLAQNGKPPWQKILKPRPKMTNTAAKFVPESCISLHTGFRFLSFFLVFLHFLRWSYSKFLGPPRDPLGAPVPFWRPKMSPERAKNVTASWKNCSKHWKKTRRFFEKACHFYGARL